MSIRSNGIIRVRIVLIKKIDVKKKVGYLEDIALLTRVQLAVLIATTTTEERRLPGL